MRMIYFADPTTGQFCGSAAKKDGAVFEHGFTDAPPTPGAGCVCVRESGEWLEKPDNRGEWFHPTTQACTVVENIGDAAPVDHTQTPPTGAGSVFDGSAWVTSVDTLRQRKIVALTEKLWTQRAHVLHSGAWYFANAIDRELFAIYATSNVNVFLRRYEGPPEEMTPEEFAAFLATLNAWDLDRLSVYSTKAGELQTLQTSTEIENYDVQAGW